MRRNNEKLIIFRRENVRVAVFVVAMSRTFFSHFESFAARHETLTFAGSHRKRLV